MRNGLTGPMLERPDLLDWGISEIAQLDVIPPCELGVNRDLLAMRFLWEWPRTIEVACSQVSIALGYR
jgi:hypothetical protein